MVANVRLRVGNFAMVDLESRMPIVASFAVTRLRLVGNAGMRILMFAVPKQGPRAASIAPVGVWPASRIRRNPPATAEAMVATTK